MRARLGGAALTVGYGHVGDGNLHLNISAKEYSDELFRQIEPFVYEWTAARDGSISAEHGLGSMKAGYIGYTKSPEAVAMMRTIKRSLDPKGILNPYKTVLLEDGRTTVRQRSVSWQTPPRSRPAYSTKQATTVMSSSLPPVGTFFCICSNRLSCTSPASTASAMKGDG